MPLRISTYTLLRYFDLMPIPMLSNRTKWRSRKTIDHDVVQLRTPAEDFVENHVRINSDKSNRATESKGSEQSPSQGTSEQVAEGAAAACAERWTSATATPSHVEASLLATDEHCELLRTALEEFEASLPPKEKTTFSVSSQHTWNEVIAEARFAEMAYMKRGGREGGPFGKVRGYLHILQRNTARLDGWLDLLPSQSTYASVLCGGIKIVLRAATKMHEVREMAMKALASVPDEVEKAQLMIDYSKGLKPSDRLRAKVAAMYICVFVLLKHVVEWYGQRSAARHLKALLHQDNYEQEMGDKIDSFKEAVQAVKAEAELCGLSRSQDIFDTIQRIEERQVAWEEYQLSQAERPQEQLELYRNLAVLLKSHPALHPRTGQMLQNSYSPQPPRSGKPISRSALCNSVLGYDAEIPSKDLGTMIRYGHELSLQEQDRIIFAIEDQRFKTWLAAPYSSALLIKGNATNIASAPVCSMSFLAAHFINSINALPNSRMVCIQWFTSEHRNVRTSTGSVVAIMRSLIGQLVNLHRFDLYFIKRSTAQAIRDYDDLEVLCNVFDQLITQLPPKVTVFCVIDWLARLEYEYKEEVQFLVERLHRAAKFAGDQGNRFKLLLTHAGGAFNAAAEFAYDSDECLVLPEAVPGSRMGFNQVVWKSKAGDSLAAMAKKEKKRK